MRCCLSRHSTFLWPFFLCQKHLFSCAIEHGDFSVSRHCLLKSNTDAVAVVAAEDPPGGFTLLYEKRKSAVLSCCLLEFVALCLRCAFMAMKESTVSVSLAPSSPICGIQLAAIVSSRRGQCSSSSDCSSVSSFLFVALPIYAESSGFHEGMHHRFDSCHDNALLSFHVQHIECSSNVIDAPCCRSRVYLGSVLTALTTAHLPLVLCPRGRRHGDQSGC